MQLFLTYPFSPSSKKKSSNIISLNCFLSVCIMWASMFILAHWNLSILWGWPSKFWLPRLQIIGIFSPTTIETRLPLTQIAYNFPIPIIHHLDSWGCGGMSYKIFDLYTLREEKNDSDLEWSVLVIIGTGKLNWNLWSRAGIHHSAQVQMIHSTMCIQEFQISVIIP